MRKVQIITDSCADLTAAQLAQYHIDYVRMTIIEKGQESPALLTWSADEAHRLYDTIRAGERITTAQVSVEEFNDVFGRYLDADCDIVYVACSSKQSGSVNTGHLVAQKLLARYPAAQIHCIDSLNSAIGEGMLAMEAAKMAESGLSAAEIAEKIIAMRKTVQEFATVHTLEHLKKAGRVSASAAFFGNLMGVKPILTADVNGAQAAYKKVKGRHNSLVEIVALLKAHITNAENQTVYIAHSDCAADEVAQLEAMVRREIPCKEVAVWYIGPIVGASVGPDAIGVWAFGQPVTFAAEND